ncbi:Zinc finger CCCH domain-containing protein 19 [Linum grandiflorum]
MDPEEDPDSIPSSDPSPPSQADTISPLPTATSVEQSPSAEPVNTSPSELRDSEPQPPVSHHEEVVDEFEEPVKDAELAVGPCGEESSPLVVEEAGKSEMEMTVEEIGDYADVQRGIAGGSGGSEDVSLVVEERKEVAVREDDCAGVVVGEQESGVVVDNVGSLGKADVEVSVKEESVSETVVTQEVEEFLMVEKVEGTEKKDDAEEEKQSDLVGEEATEKDEVGIVGNEDEAEGKQIELAEEASMKDEVDGVEKKDEVEDFQKVEDDVTEEIQGFEQKETTNVGRSIEEVDEMEVDDGVEKKDKGGEELDVKEDDGVKVSEAVKETEKAMDSELNESEVENQKLKEVAEEDHKLTGGQEEDVEMNEVEKEPERVNVAIDGDEKVNESAGEGLKLNEVAEEDQKLTGANEEAVKMKEVEKEAEKVDVTIDGDAKLAEVEGEDLKLNEVAKEDAESTEANEEVVKVEEEQNINELDEQGEKVNEAADEEEEEDEEDDKVNEAADDDDEEEDEKVNEAADEEEEELNEAEDEDKEDTDEEMTEVAGEDDKMNEEEGGEEVEDGDDEKMNEAEDTEVAEEDNVEEVSQSSSGKRKRGKNAKVIGKSPSKKKVEEDVCFICFDGGDLVLCDRRGCPKAYHPACVNRDEAFFQTKGKWYCVFLLSSQTPENFDEKTSWEYLFKDYWSELKASLSITSDEVATAKQPRKGSDSVAAKRDAPDELYEAQDDGGSASDSSADNPELTASKRRKGKKRLKSRGKERESASKRTLNGAGVSSDNDEWASKELLEFVMHMKNGDKSACSQFDVQALLLEYIKRNKLRDPRRKSQILCDARLQHLFGKPRVGHFEMLKLLESHFLLKENSQMDAARGSVDTEGNQGDGDGISDAKAGKDKKRKSRKKGQGLQSNVDDYGAIDTHNITLIYLKRSLVEELLQDTDTFNDKVVGSFVRLRISANNQKQDLYRLVQIIGTKTADNPYRVGKRTTNFLLEILNLNKTEVIAIDAISNQEFTEDECKRLRQSIKCQLLNPLTVGDIQEKAIALQGVRVQDIVCSLYENAKHGKKECVEKLQLLKSPEERQRRLEEIPEIHVDPKMDPSYESEEEEDETDNKSRDTYLRPRGSGFSRRARDPISPRKGATSPNESWGGTRSFSNMNRELTRNTSGKGFSYRGDDSSEKADDSLWSQGRDREIQPSRSWDSPKRASTVEQRNSHSVVTAELASRSAQDISPTDTASKANETQKIWHYKDPAGKVQGPFSMVQLRKWNNTGYFPADLRIWKAAENEGNSILLTDALDGNFQTPLVPSPEIARENDRPSGRSVPIAVEVPTNSSADRWNLDLPSPTPSSAGSKGRARESRWSTTPPEKAAGSQFEAHPFSAGSSDRQLAGALTPRNQLPHTPQMHSQSMVPVASPGVQQQQVLRVPNSNGVATNAAIDTAALQSLVQTISNNPLLASQGMGVVPVSSMNAASGWGTASLQRAEPNNSQMPVAPLSNAYGNWGNSPAGAHNAAAVQGTPGTVPPELWRAPMPMAQSNVQHSGQAGAQWGMGAAVADNTARQAGGGGDSGWSGIPGNQTAGWVGNMPANANANQVWGPAPAQNQGMIAGNTNPGWMQGQQQIMGGNTNAGWSTPAVQQVQGWAQGSANPNSGGYGNNNPNPGWGGGAGNNWGNERNNGVGGSGNRDRGTPQGGDSGYGGGRGGGDRPWTRQSSSSAGRSGGGVDLGSRAYNSRGQKKDCKCCSSSQQQAAAFVFFHLHSSATTPNSNTVSGNEELQLELDECGHLVYELGKLELEN